MCQQLGFSNATRAYSGSFFGPVPQPFSYDNVQCVGDEESLDQCPNSSPVNCNSSTGAGVICTNDFPSPIPKGNLYADIKSKMTFKFLIKQLFSSPPSRVLLSFLRNICLQLGFKNRTISIRYLLNIFVHKL